MALGLSENDIAIIAENSQLDVVKCAIALFGEWQRRGDFTWGRLTEALVDAEFENLAKEVTAALKYIYPK